MVKIPSSVIQATAAGLLFGTAIVVSGCSSLPLGHHFAQRISYEPAPNSAPPITGKRKYGNPYKIMGKTYYPLRSSEGYREKGIASWYGDEFHRKPTANGETYNMYAFTAAHTTLPLPTWVRVTNLENSRSIMVRVNDRGPFVRGRLIDMSYAGAKALGFDQQGTVPVLVEAMPTDGSPLRPTMLAARDAEQPTRSRVIEGSFTRRVAAEDDKDAATTPVPNLRTPSSPQVEEEMIKATPEVEEVITSDAKTLHVPVYVQTGAFSDRVNAERQMADLNKIYNNVRIMEVNSNGRLFYRVRVGPLETVDIADQVLARLIHEGYKEAIIAID